LEQISALRLSATGSPPVHGDSLDVASVPPDLRPFPFFLIGAHIPGMTEFVEWLTGTHTCDCGAKYKVTVIETPTGNVSCEKCGTLMDSRANESFLAYERMPGEE
jgi:hypothetical protein